MGMHLERVLVNLRGICKKKNKSQQQVANKLKISQNDYSKLELGKTKLNLNQLLTIADYLEINVLELIK